MSTDMRTPYTASKALYADVAKGNWAAVAERMADDFIIYEPASLPYGGEWKGKDALQRLFSHVMGYWVDPSVAWVELVGGEKHCVALLKLTATVPSTGERFETHIAEVTQFNDDGKAASMRIHYFDTADMLAKLNA